MNVALILFLAASAATAGLGAAVTLPNIDGWYHHLARPSWTPPDWAFGPAWSLLYLMMAVAAWLVWRVPRDCMHSRSRRSGLQFYGIQLILNALWSPLFFGLHLVTLALVDIGAMILAVLATIWWFGKARPNAALLMVPYLAWICYAASLNAAILWLNPH